MSEAIPNPAEYEKALGELEATVDRLFARNPGRIKTDENQQELIVLQKPRVDEFVGWDGIIARDTQQHDSFKVETLETDYVGGNFESTLIEVKSGVASFHAEEFDPSLEDEQEPPVSRAATLQDIESTIKQLHNSAQFVRPELSPIQVVARKIGIFLVHEPK